MLISDICVVPINNAESCISHHRIWFSLLSGRVAGDIYIVLLLQCRPGTTGEMTCSQLPRKIATSGLGLSVLISVGKGVDFTLRHSFP